MKFSEYSEEKRHGARVFPVEYYFLSEGHPQYVMPPHWHKEIEIIRVISGEFCLFINNEEQMLRAGDVFIFGGQTLHRGEPKDCVYECIVFDAGMLCKKQADAIDGVITPLLTGESGIKPTLTEGYGELTAAISELFEVMKRQEEYYELMVSSLLFRVIFLLYNNGFIRSAEKMPHVGKKTRTIISILSWIEDHYSEPINLDDLSAMSGLNPKYLCRIFKEYTSRSPMAYVNELRMDYACHEIIVNKKSITTAAYDSGFNDSGYFSKSFKKYKGMTPRQYVKSLK